MRDYHIPPADIPRLTWRRFCVLVRGLSPWGVLHSRASGDGGSSWESDPDVIKDRDAVSRVMDGMLR